MLNEKRFELALEKIAPSNWERFEKFASAFLTDEFPHLRTVASPSGDEGRDAELFSPEGDVTVVLQYSVTESWGQKIKATAKKISEKHKDANLLIYVTNQAIGAKADDVRKEVRNLYKLTLDIRDRSYFLDRFQGVDRLEVVAESLARDIVDPFLASREVIETKAQALTIGENRAAHLFLELQWADDSRDKGLTKTAFDGLVRMALRQTTSADRLSRSAVYAQVHSLLSNADQAVVEREVDKSLRRLTKSVLRHHEKEDEFCLTHEESTRIKGRLAAKELDDRQLVAEVRAVVQAIFPADALTTPGIEEQIIGACRLCVERFLMQRGELFVSALDNDVMRELGFDAVREIAKIEIAKSKLSIAAEPLGLAMERVLTSSGPGVEKYLRGIADTYTLLAFLREAPDVQRAVKKMFSSGEIWLDTNIVLPLIAEDIVPEEERHFRRLISIVREAGLKVRVAPGVLEEVERHANRALVCANVLADWKGEYPFLYSFYISSGADSTKFSSWMSIFMGASRPEDDISEFLLDLFGVETIDISLDAAKVDQALRGAVQEEWLEIHNKRRNRFGEFDPALSLRLASHDTDNYVGVIARRRQEGSSAIGYSSWWLTLDSMAFRIAARIKPRLAEKTPPSPVMSADFLTNYLAFGPLRQKVARSEMPSLPLSLDPSSVQDVTQELVDLATAVRKEAHGLPERVVRRKVRDALDAARRRTGRITSRGLRVGQLIEQE